MDPDALDRTAMARMLQAVILGAARAVYMPACPNCYLKLANYNTCPLIMQVLKEYRPGRPGLSQYILPDLVFKKRTMLFYAITDGSNFVAFPIY